MSTNQRLLTQLEIAWAYRKYCEDVPIASLANALCCSTVTIRRAFDRYGLQKKNTLKFERGTTMSDYEKKVVEHLRSDARKAGTWDPGKEDMLVAADLIEELCGQRDALIEMVGQLKKERDA